MVIAWAWQGTEQRPARTGVTKKNNVHLYRLWGYFMQLYKYFMPLLYYLGLSVNHRFVRKSIWHLRGYWNGIKLKRGNQIQDLHFLHYLWSPQWLSWARDLRCWGNTSITVAWCNISNIKSRATRACDLLLSRSEHLNIPFHFTWRGKYLFRSTHYIYLLYDIFTS